MHVRDFFNFLNEGTKQRRYYHVSGNGILDCHILINTYLSFWNMGKQKLSDRLMCGKTE